MWSWILGFGTFIAIIFFGLLISGALQLNRSDWRCDHQTTRFVEWREYREISNFKLMWPVIGWDCSKYRNTKDDSFSTNPF